MDIIQWADNSKRTGTLLLRRQEQQKKIYMQDGKIIFIWSENEGERIADFLQLETAASQKKLKEALADSELLGLSFVGYLYSEKLINRPNLEEALKQVAEAALTDVLRWETGTFEFIDELPSFVLNGPVKLNSTQIMLESTQKFDETCHSDHKNADQVITEIINHIKNGNIELPPIPDIMQRISAKISNPNISVNEVVDCITDQILVSKILKICNSPYYKHANKVSTLKDAVIYIGLRSLMSIITVHALSSFSPKNVNEIKKILQHSLACGMIARQIAKDMNGDDEQAFICGLLHDIGKTVILDMIGDYMLSDDQKYKLVEEYHTEVGYLLAQKWNFGRDIQESIRFHHAPENSTSHKNLVEIIYLSNIMTYSSYPPDEISNCIFTSIDLQQVNMTELMNKIDDLDKDAKAIITT